MLVIPFFCQMFKKMLLLLDTLIKQTKQTSWCESASERARDRRLSAKLVPNFADRVCHVVSVTDPYGRILGFLDRSRYFFFQVAPQLYSRGWVDPVPEPILLRKSGSGIVIFSHYIVPCQTFRKYITVTWSLLTLTSKSHLLVLVAVLMISISWLVSSGLATGVSKHKTHSKAHTQPEVVTKPGDQEITPALST
jgi:hypothetical protein